jgi:hypothetical protein
MDRRDPLRPSSPLLSGDYEYMTAGYYACQDAELAGEDPLPACADALDAYVVPIALEKAAKAGVAVPDWILTHEYFPVPAVCYGVNPFSRRHEVVREESARRAVARRLTGNFRYSMCCQLITRETEVVEFRMVCGRTESAEFEGWADSVFSIFRVPLATVRLLRGARLQLSAIEPLPRRVLTPAELAWARGSGEARRG